MKCHSHREWDNVLGRPFAFSPVVARQLRTVLEETFI
jgi:hypothetical protein